MGSFSVRICRACRPPLEAKTKVPAIASRKARPTATVRRHDSPTIQYSRFGSETFSGPLPDRRFRASPSPSGNPGSSCVGTPPAAASQMKTLAGQGVGPPPRLNLRNVGVRATSAGGERWRRRYRRWHPQFRSSWECCRFGGGNRCRRRCGRCRRNRWQAGWLSG